jgi:hypothetical protein
MIWRNGSDGFDDRLICAENCEGVAVAEDLDRPFGGAPQRGVVDRRDCRVAAWPSQGDGSNGRYHTTSDWMRTSSPRDLVTAGDDGFVAVAKNGGSGRAAVG